MEQIKKQENIIVGVDFDNTLISYDTVFYKYAMDFGWIDTQVPSDKQHIRDFIRQYYDGEQRWQKLQGLIYGSQMHEASLISGVRDFCINCHQANIDLYIVSHKTEYAADDSSQTNLRAAAFTWMQKNEFFSSNGLAINPKNIYFESTRAMKINRIIATGCHYFIDDLVEVLLDNKFPKHTKKILYAPNVNTQRSDNLIAFTQWQAINEYIMKRSFNV